MLSQEETMRLNVSNESVTSSKHILSQIVKVLIFEPNEGKFICLENPLFLDPSFLSHAGNRNCSVSPAPEKCSHKMLPHSEK